MITAAARDFSGWRGLARGLLAAGHAPEAVCWTDGAAAEGSLFASPDPFTAAPGMNGPPVPAAFLAQAERVACHRDSGKWGLLYAALWRLTHGEPHLTRVPTDPLMHRLAGLDAAVRRDSHKTQAFVRFRRVLSEEGEWYIAWHRPDHRILPLVAPFFQRRFSAQKWSILTPDEGVVWDGAALRHGPGVASSPVEADACEALWTAYYRATFNPARLNTRLMKREMPVRHWPTLPEAAAIPGLLRDAAVRVARMVEGAAGPVLLAAEGLPPSPDHETLRLAAKGCEACPLHRDATATVFGHGPVNARVMLVGEQPGEEEDRGGAAFLGPAGQVLDAALSAAGVPRESLYLTNAVKHFGFEQRGKRRQHRSPGAREITACKPWLLAEIGLVRPAVIVTLGVTAARAVLHHGFALGPNLNRRHAREEAVVLTTWHPAAALRAATPEAGETIARDIADCLRDAARLAGEVASLGAEA